MEVAQGLGDRVVVGGLSMGGSVAAWLGLRRPEVTVALSIAPVLSPLPGLIAVNRLAAFLLRVMPNRMVWWDPKGRESLAGPSQAYYRYATRGMASILAMGFSFAAAASRQGPACGAFRFFLNDNDEALSNTLADRIAGRWKSRGVKNAAVVRLSREQGFMHDFIDPDQPYQRVDLAYPLLMDAITEALDASTDPPRAGG